ncbi:MAG: hypothetical protein KJ749_09960 [Planctomycetes bacterium]|nr:hypothetical protein [Planctomycetota bacterium]
MSTARLRLAEPSYVIGTSAWTARCQRLPDDRQVCDDGGYTVKTPPIVTSKGEAAQDHHRTKDTILEIYDEMAECMASGEQRVANGEEGTTTDHSPLTTGRRVYQTRLDPPPGPPADAEGNFLPLPQWLPGQPQPADWPSHIHPPREVAEERV